MILQSEVDEQNKNKRLKIGLIFLTVILIAIVLYSVFRFNRDMASAPLGTANPSSFDNAKSHLTGNAPELKETDFGTLPPPEFPSDIPIEKDAKVNQSYGLDYPDEKQLTIVFTSMKTMKGNFDIYADYLKQAQWTVLSQVEKPDISFLYATKEGMEMSVTVTNDFDISPQGADGGLVLSHDKPIPSRTTSQVSVSVLRR